MVSAGPVDALVTFNASSNDQFVWLKAANDAVRVQFQNTSGNGITPKAIVRKFSGTPVVRLKFGAAGTTLTTLSSGTHTITSEDWIWIESDQIGYNQGNWELQVELVSGGEADVDVILLDPN